MSLFYFPPLFLGFILFPVNSSGQACLNRLDQKSPLVCLSGQTDTTHFIGLRYTSPFGISSLNSVNLNYQLPLGHGRIVSEFHALGIPGYYQFKLGAGFGIRVDNNLTAFILLHAITSQIHGQGISKLSPGSSVYINYLQRGRFFTSLRIDDWPGFILSDKHYHFDPNIRINSQYFTYSGISLVFGLSYEAGLSPLLTGGLILHIGKLYKLGAGMQSGPTGFWIAFAFSRKNLDLIISLNSSGVFGYEPSTLFKYHLK